MRRYDNNNRTDISTKQIVNMYEEKGLSAGKIARLLACSEGTVLNRLKSAGVKRRKPATYYKKGE